MNTPFVSSPSIPPASTFGLDGERQFFSLAYQPQVRCSDRQICGLEALLRWSSPETGAIPPSDFVPLAEQSGLIHDLGLWAIELACRQARTWQLRGLPHMTVSVNVSPVQLDAPDFPGRVGDILRATELPADCLDLEITESSILGAPNRTLPTLHALKSLGVHLSLDDFGTGYSSLSYLRLYPFDTLKLDRAFVVGLPNDAACATLSRTIVNLAHEFDMSVVAEGVENESQFRALRKMRCDVVQGYLIARPESACDIVPWIEGYRARDERTDKSSWQCRLPAERGHWASDASVDA